jgi:hypothetical protein
MDKEIEIGSLVLERWREIPLCIREYIGEKSYFLGSYYLIDFDGIKYVSSGPDTYIGYNVIYNRELSRGRFRSGVEGILPSSCADFKVIVNSLHYLLFGGDWVIIDRDIENGIFICYCGGEEYKIIDTGMADNMYYMYIELINYIVNRATEMGLSLTDGIFKDCEIGMVRGSKGLIFSDYYSVDRFLDNIKVCFFYDVVNYRKNYNFFERSELDKYTIEDGLTDIGDIRLIEGIFKIYVRDGGR